jgi:hypothetical protein
LEGELFSQSQASAEKAFLIKDAHNREIGYYLLEKSMHRFEDQYFEVRNQQWRSYLLFQQWPDVIRWKTSVYKAGLRRPETYDILTEEEGHWVVQRSDSEHTTPVFCDHFMLPEPMLSEFGTVFLKGPHDAVCIDVLTHDGRIMPVCLKKISPEQANAGSDNVAAVVRIEYLFLRNYVKEILFDDSSQIIGFYIRLPNRQIRRWDATTTEQLQNIFKDSFRYPEEQTACANITELK